MFKPWAVEDKWGFEFTDGIYQGVVVEISNLSLDGVDNQQVVIEYHNIFIPAHLSESEIKTEAYEVALHNVVNEIITEAALDYEQNRNNNPT